MENRSEFFDFNQYDEEFSFENAVKLNIPSLGGVQNYLIKNKKNEQNYVIKYYKP